MINIGVRGHVYISFNSIGIKSVVLGNSQFLTYATVRKVRKDMHCVCVCVCVYIYIYIYTHIHA